MNKILLFLVSGLIYCGNATAEIFPLSLQTRVNECQTLITGEVISTTSYWDDRHENIYTLYEIEIGGYWKGLTNATHIGLVDLGGTVGNDMQITNPAVRLSVGSVGVFMLGAAIPNIYQSKTHVSKSPNFIQAYPTASIQGAILYNNGVWMDPSNPHQQLLTAQFFQQLVDYSGSELVTVNTKKMNFNKIGATENGLQSQTSKKTLAVTTLQNGNSVTTTNFNSGVSNNASMEMIINGSGFGSTAGTIEFPNADAGGASNKFTFPGSSPGLYSNNGAPSDIISWTNTQIRIRVPPSAGTGTMEVFNASNVSQGTASITIDWALNAVYTSFSGFATETSQFVKLINDNSAGGYTFEMSSAGSANFFTNVAAKTAFKRSMDTWRCGTSINFDLNLATATAAGYASDGVNAVLFDNTLPSGVLGRATSRLNGSANGACNMHNSFWRTGEVDLQFQVIPSAGFTWNYNSVGTTSSQFSFETVALHELGHAHGMGHVIDNNKVMYYANSNGSQNVTLNASDIAAGNYKVSNSTPANCITSPSSMIALINPCTPLSLNIELNAQIVASDNEVQWSVANENGIAQYEVENGIDGIEFVKIGAIKAKITGERSAYTFLHTNPQTNLNYYRLKIVDAAGKISYSKIISLSRQDRNDYSISPNPTSGTVNIHVFGLPPQPNKISYRLTDMNGRTLLTNKTIVNDPAGRMTINLDEVPAGMYFIQLNINEKQSTQKIVKQ